MRPIKLTMSAFGPYAGLETIDFTMLKEKNIFLITGPTGAGKTTIFDAINYALFGEASGSSRGKDSLRSDFAALEIPTYVALAFELRGKVYKITRYPQQSRVKSRGEGFTVKNAEAHLTLPNDKVITKVNNVDEKIREILGINKNQFTQIVMLPQGEFRKLLEADSVEREEIFRKIFGTEAFEAIQRKLDDKKKTLYRSISERKTKRDTHVKHLESGTDELLTQLIAASDLNIIEIVNRTKELVESDLKLSQNVKKAINENKQLQEKLQKSILQGETTNKKLKERDELKQQYELALLKEEEYAGKKVKLEQARKAYEVKAVEDAFLDRQKNLALKQNQLEETEKRLKETEKRLHLCENQYEAEERKEDDRKKISDNLATLRNQEDKVKEYTEKTVLINGLKAELTNIDNERIKIKGLIEEAKAQYEEAKNNFMDTQKAETQKEKIDNVIKEKDTLLSEMRILYKNTEHYIKKMDDHARHSKSFETYNTKYNGYKLKYEHMEDNFRRGQAGILAKELVEGKACPVCGATHHPQLAQIIDGVPTEKELEEAKNEFEKLKEEREQRLGHLLDLNGIIKSSKDTLLDQKEKMMISLDNKIATMSEKELLLFISETGKKINVELKKLEEQQDRLLKIVEQKQTLETFINKQNSLIKEKEKLLIILENKRTEMFGKVQSEQALIFSIEKEIPEELRSSAKFSSRIKALEDKLKDMERAYKIALANYNQSKTEYATIESDKNIRLKNIEEAEKEVTLYQEQLLNKINAAGFKDYEQYTMLRMTGEEIESLEKDIVQYYQNLKSLKDRLEKVLYDTEGIEEVSLELLEDDLKEFKQQEQQLLEKEKNIFSRTNNNKKTLKEIEKISDAISIEEEKYRVIGEISRIANGDNSERITFERYVLAAYFDEIIDAANVRLSKMAGGRYVLRRKEEKGKGRKQEGLELEVFDNYTGKARHVKTLSGGESFKASLALALGLADVVQSYAGGISLDTMFIDEGFGTLDPESLDNAIQCLIDLQEGGRLVGIISHVPELKERIDVRLEITPAKEGSKAKFVM